MKVKRNANGALIVGREEFEAARTYLRDHSGVDFERFWNEATVESLLHDPIGPTESCLSIDDILAVSGPPVLALPQQRLSSVKAHLNACRDCQESLALYRELEATSSRGLQREPEFVLGPWAHLRQEAGAVVLDLTLLARAVQSLTSVIVEHSVQLAGAVSAHGCTVTAVDFMPESPLRGFRATFHPHEESATLGVEPVCDWVDLRGELESGQTFNVRSLVCISRQLPRFAGSAGTIHRVNGRSAAPTERFPQRQSDRDR